MINKNNFKKKIEKISKSDISLYKYYRKYKLFF